MLRDDVLALARRYDFDEGHSLQDERLTLRLYDETTRLGLHRLGTLIDPVTPRDLLSSAALLHDIGYAEGYEQHHKTTFRLVMAADLSLSNRERSLVALIARYHRSNTPDPAKHAAFAALSVDDRHMVTELGSILRFADGLDRTHTGAVSDLSCDLNGNRLTVRLLPGRNDAQERWAGQKKARWFESVFEVKVLLA